MHRQTVYPTPMSKNKRQNAGPAHAAGTARPGTAKRASSREDGPLHLYGLHTVLAALKNPRRRKIRLQATPNALARLEENQAQPGLLQAQTCTPRELDRIAGPGAVHQGVVLTAFPLPRTRLEELENPRLLIILDQITDPHNVGAILRSACAFGASAVITTTRHAPQETGVMAKSASGALDLVPMIEVNNLGEAIKSLKKRAVWCIGLDSEAELSLEQATTGQATALILGAEGRGLRHKTRQLCDQMLRLDMKGAIKSLNVSNAAAIAMYALTR